MNTLKKLRQKGPQQGTALSLTLPILQVPQYRAGTYGRWTMGRSPDNVFTTGYFTGWAHEAGYFGLMKDGQIWMTTSRLERESHAIHLKHAFGTVVVCGVGMGMFLFNLAARDEVKHVVAVDIDAEVIQLMQAVSDFQHWPGREKISFVQKDALELNMGDLALNHPIDYLYVDIWPTLGAPLAIVETARIAGHVAAKTIGWWGQEIDIADWWKAGVQEHRQVLPLGKDVAAFAAQKGFSMQEPTDAYAAACVAVGNTFAKAHTKPAEGQALFSS